MKIKSSLIVLLSVLMLTACSNKSEITVSQDSFSVSPTATPTFSESDEKASVSGDLRLCNPFSSGGSSTTDGYYFTQLRPDGNLNIKYLDYSTHSQIALCNRPNCTHEDESCNSFVRSDGLIPSLAVVDHQLLIVNGGISVPNPTNDDLPHIDIMQLDGSNKKRLYSAKASAEFCDLICDDKSLYTIERVSDEEGAAPVVTQSLVRFSIENGERQVLADLGENTVYFCGTDKTCLYYFSIAPKEGSQSFAETVKNFYCYDINKNQLDLLDSVAWDDTHAITVAQGKIYTVDWENDQIQISETDLVSGKESVIAQTQSVVSDVRSCSIRNAVSNQLVFDILHTDSNGDLADATYAVDLTSGIVKSWPLYYDSEISPQPLQVKILADLPDFYLVECGDERLDVNYGEYGTFTMSSPLYATITKVDFWDGQKNYTYFK